jgi:hypothetical protein
MESMVLTAQQVAQYRLDGYVCPVPVMTSPKALGLRRRLEAVEARQGRRLVAVQRSRAFLLFKWLDDLIRDPRVLDPVEQLRMRGAEQPARGGRIVRAPND